MFQQHFLEKLCFRNIERTGFLRKKVYTNNFFNCISVFVKIFNRNIKKEFITQMTMKHVSATFPREFFFSET